MYTCVCAHTFIYYIYTYIHNSNPSMLFYSIVLLQICSVHGRISDYGLFNSTLFFCRIMLYYEKSSHQFCLRSSRSARCLHLRPPPVLRGALNNPYFGV